MSDARGGDAVPTVNEAGGSAQQRYDELAALDRADRRTHRGRPARTFLITVTVVAGIIFGALQLVNNRFAAWQSSLPGQTAGGHQPFTLSTALLFTGVLTVFVAAPLAVALWGRRQSTENYRIGAEGERATARQLAPLTDRGWVLLHDRTIPGRRENIDHITVGPTGIAVIDAKKWSGRAVVTHDTLKFNGRDQSRVLAQVGRQAAAIERVLTPAGLTVELRRIVCFHQSEITRPDSTKKNPARPQGVRVCGPRQLAEAVAGGPTLLTPAEVLEISARLDRALPPATVAPTA